MTKVVGYNGGGFQKLIPAATTFNGYPQAGSVPLLNPQGYIDPSLIANLAQMTQLALPGNTGNAYRLCTLQDQPQQKLVFLLAVNDQSTGYNYLYQLQVATNTITGNPISGGGPAGMSFELTALTNDDISGTTFGIQGIVLNPAGTIDLWFDTTMGTVGYVLLLGASAFAFKPVFNNLSNQGQMAGENGTLIATKGMRHAWGSTNANGITGYFNTAGELFCAGHGVTSTALVQQTSSTLNLASQSFALYAITGDANIVVPSTIETSRLYYLYFISVTDSPAVISFDSGQKITVPTGATTGAIGYYASFANNASFILLSGADTGALASVAVSNPAGNMTLSGNGTAASPLIATLNLSGSNNALTNADDGLFLPTMTGYYPNGGGSAILTNGDGKLDSGFLPAPMTSALGGVKAVTAVAHQWVNAINTSGQPLLSQPNFTDLAGTAAAAQLPTNLAAASYAYNGYYNGGTVSGSYTLNGANGGLQYFGISGNITGCSASGFAAKTQYTLVVKNTTATAYTWMHPNGLQTSIAGNTTQVFNYLYTGGSHLLVGGANQNYTYP